MNCVVCHGVDIEKKNVNEEFYSGSDVVMVPVSVLVCKDCGERYYDRSVKRYLEEIQGKLADKSVLLENVGVVLTVSK